MAELSQKINNQTFVETLIPLVNIAYPSLSAVDVIQSLNRAAQEKLTGDIKEDISKWLKASAFAKKLGVTPQTVRKHCKNGLIRCAEVFGEYRIDPDEVTRCIYAPHR